jgi:hypothetical protein
MQPKLTSFQLYNKLPTSFPIVDISIRNPWLMWVCVMVLTFIIQLSTIDVLPSIQQDEVQITDYGRLVLDPKSDWSVTWRVAEGKPLLLWSYLGPLIAEISFQIGGVHGIGPRIASLIGGLAAATMVFGWLLARKLPIYAALGLSLAFLLDPLFVLSQRMARVDSWVITLCIGACWLLHVAQIKGGYSLNRGRLMLAGAFAATATLVWPSAVFLFPLIILELVQLDKAENVLTDRIKSIASIGFYFFVGGAITMVLLIIPIWQNLVIIFNDMTTMVSQNIDSSKTFQSRIFSLFNYQLWLKMIKAFLKTSSPFFPLFAIAGVLIRWEKWLILVTILTITMIFASLVYEFRVMYLLPYFLLLSSGIFIQSAESSSSLLLKRGRIVALSVLIAWSVGTSLLVRTAFGIEGKFERNRNKIYQAAATAIGPGNYKVFLGFTYEFYFVGRSLGWHLYTPYIQFSYDDQGNWIREKDYKPKDKLLKLLSEMDYAVFSKGAVDKELTEQLTLSGLHYNSTFSVSQKHGGVQSREAGPIFQNRNMATWLLFIRGVESYGSFVLYSREKSNNFQSISLNGE